MSNLSIVNTTGVYSCIFCKNYVDIKSIGLSKRYGKCKFGYKLFKVNQTSYIIKRKSYRYFNCPEYLPQRQGDLK